MFNFLYRYTNKVPVYFFSKCCYSIFMKNIGLHCICFIYTTEGVFVIMSLSQFICDTKILKECYFYWIYISTDISIFSAASTKLLFIYLILNQWGMIVLVLYFIFESWFILSTTNFSEFNLVEVGLITYTISSLPSWKMGPYFLS